MTATENPFIPPRPSEPPPNPSFDDEHDDMVLCGPSTPDVAPTAHPQGEAWPTIEISHATPVMVMGLHGGAGASTVARLLGDVATDCGTHWPLAGGWVRPRPSLSVIAVCRTHRSGLDAGFEFGRQWASRMLPEADQLAGIVVIDDGPKLLSVQKTAVKQIRAMTRKSWHLPWIEEWRVERPDLNALPSPARKLMKSIRKNLQL